ncbi:MAG TPA: deoxyribose-phosphate aldolase [Beijerinckiaceae bacterium]|nr:deoxyribose-phosphate aldolase [Beijerinckiaceae bacterium]
MSMQADLSLARRAMALMDLTELGDGADEAAVRHLCATARGGNGIPAVAAVCVWPRHVRLARQELAGIRVATVVNFPTGGHALADVQHETRMAMSDGADEIDFVLPYRMFLAGGAGVCDLMLRLVRGDIPFGKRLKVILETGAFPDAASIRRAADLTIAAGADFIKTSTGKIATGATPEAARVMLEAIRAAGRPVGLKPSGGIRTLADARLYLDLADSVMGPGWARPETFRFGASGLHASLAAVIKSDAPPTAQLRY